MTLVVIVCVMMRGGREGGIDQTKGNDYETGGVQEFRGKRKAKINK